MNIDLAEEVKLTGKFPFEFKYDAFLEHQKLGGSWMYSIEKGLLLDDMGTGKTFSTIAALELFSRDKIIKGVIFTPSPVISEWTKALSLVLGWKLIVIEGSLSARQAKYQLFNELDENTILLTNYTRPLHDEKEMQKLKVNAWFYDEVTFAKNPESKIYKLLYSLSKKDDIIFPITGTPTTLSFGDIYWIFSLLKIDGVVSSFEEEIEPLLLKLGKSGFYNPKIIGASDIQSFLDKIESYILHRSLNEVVVGNTDITVDKGVAEDLSISDVDMNLEVVPLRISDLQREAFNDLKSKANRAAREGNYKPLTFWSDFYKVCSSQALLNDYPKGMDPKAQYAIDYVSKIDDKVVIFVKYLEYQKMLYDYFKDAGISVLKLSGEYSIDEQRLQIDFFLDSSTRVLLLTEVAKFGVNLQGANHVLFLSLPRNPADFVQMMARVYRLGQKKDVFIKLCFMENTVEEDGIRDLCERQKVYDYLFKDTNFSEYLKRDANYVRGFLEKDYSK